MLQFFKEIEHELHLLLYIILTDLLEEVLIVIEHLTNYKCITCNLVNQMLIFC